MLGLKGQCHENCFKTETLGVMCQAEPLLKFVYSPLNLLQYFKDGVHRGKKIDNIIVSDPDSSGCLIVSGTDLPANF